MSKSKAMWISSLIPLVILSMPILLPREGTPSNTRLSAVTIFSEKTVEADPFSGKRSGRMVVSQGAGVMLSEEGPVLTVAHLVEKANERHYIRMASGDEGSLEAIMIDMERDLALMAFGKSKKGPLPAFAQAQKGQRVTVVTGTGEVRGEVIGTDVSIEAFGSGVKKDLSGLIEVSVPLLEGVSGSPLFNSEAELMGIVVAVGANKAFAIPSKTIEEFLSLNL